MDGNSASPMDPAMAEQPMMDNNSPSQTGQADHAEAADTAPQAMEGNADTIARAQFTSAVADREPTDNITSISNDAGRVYYFTEIVNAQGETYTHRWEYQGQTMAQVNFNIGGPRWRVYSEKSLKPEWTGTWTVTVLDSAGNPVKVENIEVVEAMPAPANP